MTEPPIPTTPPRRPHSILGRLADGLRRQDWFTVAVEVAVVVIGVVIGFQVTAWGQARSDRAREQTYLRQIAADLQTAESRLDASIARNRHSQRAAARLLRAFYDPGAADPDSVRQWLSDAPFFRTNPARFDGLRRLAAEDLQLIRADSVRNGVLTLLDDSDALADAEAKVLDHYYMLYPDLRAEVSFAESWVDDLGPGASDSLAHADDTFPVPPGARAHPFPIDLSAFLRSRTAYATVEGLWEVSNDHRRLQVVRRDWVRDLEAVVRRALDR